MDFDLLLRARDPDHRRGGGNRAARTAYVADFYGELMTTLRPWARPCGSGRPRGGSGPVPFASRTAPRTTRTTPSGRALLADRRGRRVSPSRGRSSASAARCTSSGAASTWRSPAFQAGRRPARGPAVTREAYSHEVISHGFWPGGGATRSRPRSTRTPRRAGRPEDGAPSDPPARSHHGELREFVLPYDEVRRRSSAAASCALSWTARTPRRQRSPPGIAWHSRSAGDREPPVLAMRSDQKSNFTVTPKVRGALKLP